MNPPVSDIKKTGHLGLVVAIFRKYKIVQMVDRLLPKRSNHQKISHGQALLALVLQGMSFENRRLYLSEEFFSHYDLEQIFGPGIKSEHFNPSTLARTLDAIYKHGATQFFIDVCLGIVLNHKILKKFIFMDTTSFAVMGRKYKGKGSIELKHGHSKDYRMDLRQLVYLLVSSEDGVPLFGECYSGNASDSAVFQQKIIQLQEIIDEHLDGRYLVLDSALYNKAFLKNKDICCDWITRVPESIKACKMVVTKKRHQWNRLDDGYKYFELFSKHGGKKQRWIVVSSRSAKHKEQATFRKKLDNQEVNLTKKVKKLQRRFFEERADAKEELEQFSSSHPNFIIKGYVIAIRKRIPGTKRKRTVGYKIKARYERNLQQIEKILESKGKFVLATNKLDGDELSAEEVIRAYRDRNKGVESCFKYLKNKTLNLNQIFLKKESRIEAMMIVMTFILLVNNLGEMKLRDHLVRNIKSVPDQRGRPTQKPTFMWASYFLRNVCVVTTRIGRKVYRETVGIRDGAKEIIKAFGKEAIAIYGFT